MSPSSVRVGPEPHAQRAADYLHNLQNPIDRPEAA
jgi:hypothetical protein